MSANVSLPGTCPDTPHTPPHTKLCLQGYKQKKAYIIAEGPMASTTRNMWKVVQDRKCAAVVMLSDLLEEGMVTVWLTGTCCWFNRCLVDIVRRAANSTGQRLLGSWLSVGSTRWT